MSTGDREASIMGRPWPTRSCYAMEKKNCVVEGHSLTCHDWQREESTDIAPLTVNLGARRGWVINFRPRPLYPGEDLWYQVYSSLGGLQGRCRQIRKKENFSPPPRFNPRTVQPAASCHTNFAIPSPDH